MSEITILLVQNVNVKLAGVPKEAANTLPLSVFPWFVRLQSKLAALEDRDELSCTSILQQ